MISCVMSVYDEPIWMIARAVRSLLKQTYQPHEIILVYDNPTNKEIGQFLKQTICPMSPIIKLLVNEQNRGLPYSLNRGIACAACDLICRMDADDESCPTRLEEEIKLMREQHLDIVATQILVVDESGKATVKQRRLPSSRQAITHISRYMACVFHPTWLFRKKVWETIGGYRESMLAAQDYDFILRALKIHFKIAAVPRHLLRYTERTKSISANRTALQLFLALYAQDNVIRNAEFSNTIIQKIKLGQCPQFEVFQPIIEKYVQSKFLIEKCWVMMLGMRKSEYFRRFIWNVFCARMLRTYYLRKEKLL